MPETRSEDKESGKWSIDFVEHLRTVHFSLIVVSIGLLLISLSEKNYDTDTAIREIQEIVDLQANWSPRWIQGNAGHTDQLINSSTPNKNVRLSDLSSDGKESETLYGRVTLSKTPKTSTYIKLLMPRNLRVIGSLSFPKTLDQFGRWWDGLNGGRRSFEIIQELSNEAWMTDKYGARVGILVISPKPFPDHNPTDTLTLEAFPFDFEGDQTYRRQDSFDLAAAIQGSDEVTRIRAARVVAISYNQDTVIRGVHTNWLSGPYEDSFKDLRLAAKGYESRPFSEGSQLISSQTGKAPETFEVFGLKFPTDYITYWGASLLLAVQLYFLIYVKQLSNKLNAGDPGWDVPWIALEQSKAGKGLYLFSVLVLPLLTLLALATRVVIPSFRHLIFVLYHTAAPHPEGLLPSVFIQGLLFLLALSISPILGLRAWRATPKMTT